MRAFGGRAFAGQDIWVGERGPEQIHMAADGNVVPTDRLVNSRPVATTLTININGAVYGIDNLHAEIRKAQMEWQRNNGRTITNAPR